jgi:hypothetical protein
MKKLSGGSDTSSAKTKAMQALYPQASFCISCRGDVCKGDEVLFAQEVFKEYTRRQKGEGIGETLLAAACRFILI